MYKTVLFRDPNDGGGAGGFSLADLTDPNKPGIKPGDPPPKTPDEEAAAAQEALVKEATDDTGALKPGYVKDTVTGLVSKDPNYTPPADDPVEGADDKGEPLPGYKKDDTGKIVVDPDYKAPEVDEVKEFFTALDNITGSPVEVEYPENVDPLSPEGFAIRDAAIREDAAIKFEQYLAIKDPRAYAYAVHRSNGGSDEEFMAGNKGFVLPTKEELAESIDLQTAIYKHDLKSRGLDDDTVEVLVKKAITDSKLKEKAEAAFTSIEKQDADLAKRIADADIERKKKDDEAIAGIVNKVKAGITEGLKFIVPETDKAAFEKFIIDNLRYDSDSGTFALVQKVGDNLNTMMDALFFQYKKGDIKTLVEKQAKTQAAQSLRARISRNNGGTGGGKAPENNSEKFIPLSDIKVTS